MPRLWCVMTSVADLEISAGIVSNAIQELEADIRSASADGLSLRAIAAATGLSHEKVRSIVRG